MLNTSEILRVRGELSVLKKEFEELDIAGNNSLITILDKLNPANIDQDITDLNIRAAEVEFKQLKETVTKLAEIKAKLEKYERMLKEIERAML